MRAKIGDIYLNYELTGSGDRCLALIHGLGGDLCTWDAQVAALSSYCCVLAWDVRGFGQSDKPPGPYSASMCASDLAGLLTAVGIERAVILGVSMGGVIAMRFALNYPEMTRALIAVSTSSEVKEQAATIWEAQAAIVEHEGLAALPQTPERVFSPSFLKAHPAMVDEYFHSRLANDPHAYAAAARAMARYNYTSELETLRCPALVIVGADDVMTPPGGSVIIHRRIAGSRLHIVPDAGHGLLVEQPDTVNRLVLDFVRALP